MISTLEREIIEKFRQLQPAAKQRVRALIEQETTLEVEPTTFDHDNWLHEVESLRQAIRADQGDQLPPVDMVELLRDIRDGEDE